MLRGIVIGNIVSTRKQDALVGSKFMEVQLMEKGERIEKYIIAVDSVGAGIGEEVLSPRVPLQDLPSLTRTFLRTL